MPCIKPNQSHFILSETCKNYEPYSIDADVLSDTKSWLIFKSFEYFIVGTECCVNEKSDCDDENHTIYIQRPIVNMELEDVNSEVSIGCEEPMDIEVICNTTNAQISDRLEAIKDIPPFNLESLALPPWNAYHSVIVRNDDATPKCTFLSCPLIPGPASDYSAVYTGLKLAQSINS